MGAAQSTIRGKPYNPVEQLEEARIMRVDQLKKTLKEKADSQLYKSYQKIEQIP